MRDMNAYEQSFYDIQVNGFEKDVFHDDFKAIGGATPEEMRDIEDARARYELVESVCKRLREVKDKLDNFSSPFHDPSRYQLPCDQELEFFKDALIDFSHKIDNPAYAAKLQEARYRNRQMNEHLKGYGEYVANAHARFDTSKVATVSHNKEMRNGA